MSDLLRDFLQSTLDTAVQAGITSLITDVDFKDAFKGQAALNVAGSILGGGSPFDLFKNKAAQPAAQPTAQGSAQAPAAAAASVPDLLKRATDPNAMLGRARQAVTQQQFPGMAGKGPLAPGAQNVFQSKLAPVAQADTRGFLESMGDVVSGDGGRMAALKQAFMPDASGDPDIFRKYGPLMGLGIGGLYAAGAFDPVEQQQVEPFGGLTGRALMRQNPGYRPGVPTLARGYAAGGDVAPSTFPRRNGAINGPGTGTSDDIPAMLSDGEFVITEKAVRAAGNGNHDAGVRNMYRMMQGLESRIA
jgi:hypothetical protein